MIKWMKKRSERRNREIAQAVYKEISASRGWEKFLPPVAVRDTIYMVTESGSVYAMRCNCGDGMERIIQIRRHH